MHSLKIVSSGEGLGGVSSTIVAFLRLGGFDESAGSGCGFWSGFSSLFTLKCGLQRYPAMVKTNPAAVTKQVPKPALGSDL